MVCNPEKKIKIKYLLVFLVQSQQPESSSIKRTLARHCKGTVSPDSGPLYFFQTILLIGPKFWVKAVFNKKKKVQPLERLKKNTFLKKCKLELNKHRSLIQFMLFKEKNFSGLNKR
jgi:hypothetical protein